MHCVLTSCSLSCALTSCSPRVFSQCSCAQVARKLAMVEADLERAEERAETGES
mgnify:CR=1 FL=1